MPIFRTAPSSNFTIINNAIANEPMPYKAKDVLLHLIEKPSHWKVIKAAICKQLQLSKYIVDKSLQWLRQQGYAFYRSSKRGGGVWYIFDTPQPRTAAIPVNTPHLVTPDRATPAPLVNTKKDNNTKIQPLPAAAPTPPRSATLAESNVVVSSELIFPAQLTPVQKKAAKHIIKKLKEPELQQEVLFALAYAITSGTVKSAPAYLQGLVKRANSGTFEPVTAATASKQGGKPLIPIWKGFGQSSPSKPETATGFIHQARAALKGIAL